MTHFNRRKKSPAWASRARQTGGGSTSLVYYSMFGRPVASLRGGVLHKRVKASIHMLRKPQGWAVDLAILEAAKRDGAQTVEVFDLETKTVYQASIEAFDLHGVRFNRGFGEQVVLPLAYWRMERRDARQLSLFR